MSLEESTIKRIFRHNVNLNTLTPFRQILHHLYYLPIDVRKFILDWSRIQQPVRINRALWFRFTTLSQDYPEIQSHPSPITIYEIVSLLDHCVSSRLQCSIISYFAKAESSIFSGSFKELFEESWRKELSASQQADVLCSYESAL
jgi:hypothetical protein